MLTEKVTVPAIYSDFADVFLEKLANVLSKQTKANEYAIKLKHGKQLPYSLGPIKFEIFKTYIKTNLANGFIKALKSPAGAPIFFCKSNGSLCLCVNY